VAAAAGPATQTPMANQAAGLRAMGWEFMGHA